MASAPETEPYSEIVAFGYLDRPVHFPRGGKVEHVRAMFSGVQVQSAAPQMPSLDSEEQAKYGCCVSYEMPVPVCESLCSHWYGPSTDPPWQEPTSPQLRMCWTARLMSMPLPLRAILMRSPRAETEPCAQHEPQSAERGRLSLVS